MLNVKLIPTFSDETIGKIEEFYTKKDGVPVKYVMTTAKDSEEFAMDIFYRETPHPEFGNRYFGIFQLPISKGLRITNADWVEDIVFDMIEDDDVFYYSRHRHDYMIVGNTAIDGGRAYTRLVGNATHNLKHVVLRDGEFFEK